MTSRHISFVFPTHPRYSTDFWVPGSDSINASCKYTPLRSLSSLEWNLDFLMLLFSQIKAGELTTLAFTFTRTAHFLSTVAHSASHYDS